ncbi:MAG: NUDIX domain-containing protein [Allosphingosinicella sp.]|uniref:NUDIX domain-containing protein n=1 Tax=Allosphingosinicella sp. TaxID=2823234 RepID=UPI0039343A42
MLRGAASLIQRARKTLWFFTRPETFGVQAIALTPAGKVILVRLTYAPGWQLPGGGRPRHEDPRAALIRELCEEIGLRTYGAVEHLEDMFAIVDHKRDSAALFLVRDVIYEPRPSLEIEAVAEFAPSAMPPGAQRVRAALERHRGRIGGDA